MPPTANLQNTVGARGTARAAAQRVAERATSATPATTSRARAARDNIFWAGAGVSYLLNRNLSLDAKYRFTKRDSDDDEVEFDRNIVLVGITARL